MTLDLMRIGTPQAFEAAWQRISAKGSRGGLDGESIESFGKRADRELASLRASVLSGRYAPVPLEQFSVRKNGKPGASRILRLPAVRDKIVQEVVRAGLERVLEPRFLNCSYGFRPRRGPQRAARRVTHEIVSGKRTWAVPADIENFFDTIRPRLLLDRLRPVVQDERVLRLLQLWIETGAVDVRGRWRDARRGIPQGTVISPLLANFYLHAFDQAMLAGGFMLVRYADDFVLLERTPGDAERAAAEARRFLLEHLGMRLKREPRPVSASVDGFSYLGIRFQGESRILDPQRLAAMQAQLDRLGTHRRDDGQATLTEYSRLVAGWRRYYGELLDEAGIQELDERASTALRVIVAEYFRRGVFGSVRQAERSLVPVETVMVRRGSVLRSFTRGIIAEARSRAAGSSAAVDRNPPKATQRVEAMPRSMRSVASVVRAAKRRHLIRRAIVSDLVVTTPGQFVGTAGDRIVVRRDRRIVIECPTARLASVTIAASGVSLSSNVITLCASRGIPLLIVDAISNVHGTVVGLPARRPETARAQLSILGEAAHVVDVAKRIAEGKIRNQSAVLKGVHKYRKRIDPVFHARFMDHRTACEALLVELRTLDLGGPVAEIRNRIFGIEGRAAQWYWDLFGAAIRGSVRFPGRHGRGATDPVNMMLNYGYAILESRAHLAVLRAGLIPEIGVLHASRSGRRSLVYDLMEEFRAPVVDRTVLAMFGRRQHPVLDRDGRLDASTRGRLVAGIRARLGTLHRYRNGEQTIEEIMGCQARMLAACLRDAKAYRPFAAKW